MCGFWGYIIFAVFPGVGESLYLAELFSTAGKLWLGVAAIQLAAIPLVVLKSEKIKWVKLILNIIPILPIFYYFHISTPCGVS